MARAVPVPLALFGAGRIGAIHGRNVAAHPRLRLAHVVDPMSNAAVALAAACGARLSSAEEALADPAVDAVLIASSTNTHVDLITASARAGKAILCEKPIDLDIERVERCQIDIAGTGVPLQIAFNRRHDRSHRAVHDAVHAGQKDVAHALRVKRQCDPLERPLHVYRIDRDAKYVGP